MSRDLREQLAKATTDVISADRRANAAANRVAELDKEVELLRRSERPKLAKIAAMQDLTGFHPEGDVAISIPYAFDEFTNELADEIHTWASELPNRMKCRSAIIWRFTDREFSALIGADRTVNGWPVAPTRTAPASVTPRIETVLGRIHKQGDSWAADVPALGVCTQGTSKEDARAMLADAIESVINAGDLKVTVGEVGVDGSVFVTFGGYLAPLLDEKNGVIRARDARIEKLAERFEAADRMVKERDKIIADNKATFAEGDARIAKLEASSARMARERDDLRTHVSAVERMLKERDAEVQTLREAVRAITKVRDEQANRLDAMELNRFDETRAATMPGRPHITTNGEFQSDKYPTCPAGKVPLSVKDPAAQDLLWEYAQRRRVVDAEFSADLEFALLGAGFEKRPAVTVTAHERTAGPKFVGSPVILGVGITGALEEMASAIEHAVSETAENSESGSGGFSLLSMFTDELTKKIRARVAELRTDG